MPISPKRQAQLVSKPSSNGQGIALNLFDLDRLDPLMREILLAGKLDLVAGAIRTDKSRLDEAAVAFSCDLLAAACICDTIRSHDRSVKDYPTRVYVRRSVAWNKVSGAALLTLVDCDGKVRLNPAVFSVKMDPADLKPPKVEKITF